MVTVCAALYVPAPGLNVGVAVTLFDMEDDSLQPAMTSIIVKLRLATHGSIPDLFRHT